MSSSDCVAAQRDASGSKLICVRALRARPSCIQTRAGCCTLPGAGSDAEGVCLNDSSSRSNRVCSTGRVVSDCSYNTRHLMSPDGSMLGVVVIANRSNAPSWGATGTPSTGLAHRACRRTYATTGPRLLLLNITGGLLRCGYLPTRACLTWQKELVPRDVRARLPDLGCVGGSDVRHLG